MADETPRVEYIITYTFHLDISRSRFVGLPDTIDDVCHVATDGTPEGLKVAIYHESKKYFGGVGVNLRFDPVTMEDDKKPDPQRLYLPWHMITHLTQNTRRLHSVTPGLGDDGTYNPEGVVPQ